MNVLVLGGTRFIGKHLVKYLLNYGHNVTIATRGQTPDTFGNAVGRILLERTDAESLSNALKHKPFDIVYDSLAFCSNDVKYLLDAVQCGRYIETSSLSVYPDIGMDIVESDFNPLTHPLKWCTKDDYGFDEIKRQAECALFQAFSKVPSVAVRFPLVIGEDDYTKRLYFYTEHIVKLRPMFIDNMDARIGFINSDEAGKFLAWLAHNDFCGSINAGSYGTVSLREMISYIEKKSEKCAIFSDNGDEAPYNGFPSYSLNLKKAEALGFSFSDLDSWFYGLLDKYVKLVKA